MAITGERNFGTTTADHNAITAWRKPLAITRQQLARTKGWIAREKRRW